MRVTGSGLIIPSGVASVKATKFHCTLCDARFYEDEMGAYERHVAKCSADREQEIAEMSKAVDGPFSEAAGFDTELEGWMRKHGRAK